MNPNDPIEPTEEEEKPREYEVQYSVKWVNFTTTVKATSEDEAIRLAGENSAEQFTVTANNEEVYSLGDILNCCERAEATCIGDEDSEEEAI
jgi:hypothetical protein